MKRARAADCQRIGASNKQVCTGRQQQQAGKRCEEGREVKEESRRRGGQEGRGGSGIFQLPG